MNPTQRIMKNVGVNGISQIFLSLIGFLFMIYLARFLGEGGFGQYNFVLSFTSLFVIFSDLGVNQLLVREVARNKELSEDYTNNAFLLKIPLSILTFLGIVFFTYFLDFQGDLVFLLYLFGLYHILQTLSLTYLSLFNALEKMEYVSLFQIVEKIIIVSLGFLILFMGYGLLEIGYVYLLAGFFDLFFAMILSFKKLIKPRFNINLKLQKDLIINGLPFGLNSLFAVFFFKIDTILLALLVGDVAVGIYNAAYNPLLTLSMIVAAMVSTAVYPVMSRQFNDSKHLLGSFAVISSKYLAIIGFPIALACLVLADKFILLFYAGSYLESILPFQILAFFIPIRMISTITGTFLSSINRQGLRTVSVCLSAAFNVVLNLLLIPLFSFVGASIATVLSEMLLYGFFIFFIMRYYGFINVNKVLIKPLLGSLAMASVIYIIRDFNLILVILTGAFV
ncbi:MAG: flippase, partial [Euryarchaeota archaeon]|nr:flippase [Euryarchaeota archaeon]